MSPLTVICVYEAGPNSEYLVSTVDADDLVL